MQVETVIEQIRKFLVVHFPLARHIKVNDPLLENGMVDSLGILEIVAFLESEFHLTVADDELVPENFHSIATLAALVQSKLNGTAVYQLED
jgi:acyl carrier protein